MSTAEYLFLAHAVSFESTDDFESIHLSTVVCALRSLISLYTVRIGCSTLSSMIADVPFFLQSTGKRTFGRETPLKRAAVRSVVSAWLYLLRIMDQRTDSGTYLPRQSISCFIYHAFLWNLATTFNKTKFNWGT